MIKVVIDERAFRDLVAGKVVHDQRTDARIILSDIGWNRMLRAILDALGARSPVSDPPGPPEGRNKRR